MCARLGSGRSEEKGNDLSKTLSVNGEEARPARLARGDAHSLRTRDSQAASVARMSPQTRQGNRTNKAIQLSQTQTRTHSRGWKTPAYRSNPKELTGIPIGGGGLTGILIGDGKPRNGIHATIQATYWYGTVLAPVCLGGNPSLLFAEGRLLV